MARSPSSNPKNGGGRFTDLTVQRDAPEGWAGGARCPSTLQFRTARVPLCVVNAVRRVILADLPVPALNFDPALPGGGEPGMRFIKNTTALHNEFLGHRLSLVPIHLDETQLVTFDPGRFRFVLRAKNTGAEVTSVTSADISVFDNMGVKYPAALRDALFPPSPYSGDHVLLARLQPSAHNDTNGDEVHIEAVATIGAGRDHARHVITSQCFFRARMDVEAAERELARRRAENPGMSEPDVAQFWALDAKRITVPDAYEFTVNSETCVRPAFLVFRAFQVLHQRVQGVLDALRTGGRGVLVSPASVAVDGADAAASTSVLRIEQMPNMDDFYHVMLRNEDHTLGNMLQGLFYDLWVRDGGGAAVPYVGYHMPHPQEPLIVIKIKLAPGGNVLAMLADGMRHVLDLLQDLNREWVSASGLAGTCPPGDEWLAGANGKAAKRRAVDVVGKAGATAK